MKRLILLSLILLFLAATFRSDSAGGWVQQTLPRSDNIIQDIFFHDSLNGWAVANKYPSSDSTFIFVTSNGGANWFTQYSNNQLLISIQFTDLQIGYSAGGTVGGTGKVYKTTNGGVNWNLTLTAGHGFTDIFFVNRDTGWVCDDDFFVGAGLLKTTNGGLNWSQQLTLSSEPSKLFFLNKDTGWVICQTNKLLRTIDGGGNWTQQFTFSPAAGDVYFRNGLTGWVSAGRFMKTTDGGFNWVQSVSTQSGGKISFANDSVGWAGQGFGYIAKTTTSGTIWFYQSSPIFNNESVCAINSLNVWAGGSGLVHTTDGGGPPVGIIKTNTEINSFSLKQNYPNPFNPVTLIFFDLPENSRVDLRVYNILGKEVVKIFSDEFFTAGVVQYGFDADEEELSSGVYFYRIIVKPENKDIIYTDTKKMVLIK